MKILLVEDEIKLAESIKKGLIQEGYVVDMLHDGEVAERRILIDTKAYDLLILDIVVPGKDGLNLCYDLRIKKIGIPILMLTARDTKDDVVKGLNSGADDYLIKPFAFEELLARIRALSRRGTKNFSRILESRGLKLNPESKEVFLEGKKVDLTLKEFNILEFLMRHQGEVISRETLLANVWDSAFDSFSNVVDVHIKNLRKKINTSDEKLETVRGVGYKIKE